MVPLATMMFLKKTDEEAGALLLELQTWTRRHPDFS